MQLTREQRLIEAIKEWTGERLLGDDCAVLPGQSLVTSDMLVEGTHFLLPAMQLDDLGWKAVAVNLSDIAAMAGRPRFAVVSLCLPAHFSDLALEKLYVSMIDCARTYRTRIVGGDLTSGKFLVISITVFGETHEKGLLMRAGARVGDLVVVSGDFGASAAGLYLLEHGIGGFEHCRRAHVRPRPRLCESWSLVRTTGSRAALMDASDGLADALCQIARASKVAIEIEAGAIPLHEETKAVAALAAVDALEFALYGGEDYELVACLSSADWLKLKNDPANPFVEIGKVTSGQAVTVRQNNAVVPVDMNKTFDHFH